MKRRKPGSNDDRRSGKRLKVTTAAGPSRAVKLTPASKAVGDQSSAEYGAVGTRDIKMEKMPIVQEKGHAKAAEAATRNETPDSEAAKSKRRVNKLVPPRPFPTVPTSVSATGPRSAHKEGKNFICITRKTPLGSYMRRCKDIILKDGYKSLHLSAMGAAVPHLLQLSVALPPILPFAADEIHTEVLTGTVEVQDEIIPDDEDEDISYQTRGKSTLMVVIKIGDGCFEGDRNTSATNNGKSNGNRGAQGGSGNAGGREGKGKKDQRVVFPEPEQDDMDIT